MLLLLLLLEEEEEEEDVVFTAAEWAISQNNSLGGKWAIFQDHDPRCCCPFCLYSCTDLERQIGTVKSIL